MWVFVCVCVCVCVIAFSIVRKPVFMLKLIQEMFKNIKHNCEHFILESAKNNVSL